MNTRKNVYLRRWAIDGDCTPAVIRGVLEADCLALLLVDSYQREAMPINNKIITGLIEAYKKNAQVDDIVLGMRGSSSDIRNEYLVLGDDVYIIDGLQRVTAALEAIKMGISPHLGAKVYFDSTHETERDHFRTLNQDRIRLSPSILLRNLHETVPAVSALYHLSTENINFVLYNRVGWNQSMRKADFIPAPVFAKTVGALHRRFGGYRSRSRVDEIANGLDQCWGLIHEKPFTANTVAFFNLINKAFTLDRVHFRNSATFLKGTFLITLALFMSANDEFWKGNYFQYDAKLAAKLGTLPYNDPTVAQLCSGGGSATNMLYLYLGEHFMGGKGYRMKQVAPLALAHEGEN